jgi:NAD-dependent DNA ligase
MYDLVFTGKPPYGTKEVWAAAAQNELGATVRPSFCSKTRLVVASEESITKPSLKVRLAWDNNDRATVLSYANHASGP